MAWTTQDLLTTVLNRQMFPTASTGSLSSAALLEFATEELYISILPMIMSVREKYYETYFDTTLTSSTTSIAIPARSVGGKVSGVQFLLGMDVWRLLEIDPSEIGSTQGASYPSNYYFQNNSVVLYPPPLSPSGSVRVRYMQRPNRLAQTTDCAQITSFDANAGTATCNSVPTTWTTANTCDFIPQTASRATPYGLDSVITNIASNVITFTSLPSATAIGDWIALSEYTPIPEIPFEFQVILAQATACKGLEAINDQTALPAASAKLAMYIENATKMLTPRDEYGSKKVVSGWRNF